MPLSVPEKEKWVKRRPRRRPGGVIGQSEAAVRSARERSAWRARRCPGRLDLESGEVRRRADQERNSKGGDGAPPSRGIMAGTAARPPWRVASMVEIQGLKMARGW